MFNGNKMQSKLNIETNLKAAQKGLTAYQWHAIGNFSFNRITSEGYSAPGLREGSGYA